MPVNNNILPYAQSFYETTLTNAITNIQTTMIVGTAPANQTGYLVIEPKSSNREIVYFSAVSGNTLTIVRGISETNTVDDTGTGTGTAHSAGVQVAMKDVHYYFNKIIAAYRGDNASGFNTFSIGDGNAVSAANRLWKANTATVSAFWGLSSSGKMVVSEDGITSYVISSGGSGIGATAPMQIVGGNMQLNTLSTGGFGTSASQLVVSLSGSLLNRNATGLYFDPSQPVYPTSTWDFGGPFRINGTLLSAGMSAVNQVINGVGATVTAANLTSLTNGSEVIGFHDHDLYDAILSSYIYVTPWLGVWSSSSGGGGASITSSSYSAWQIYSSATAGDLAVIIPPNDLTLSASYIDGVFQVKIASAATAGYIFGLQTNSFYAYLATSGAPYTFAHTHAGYMIDSDTLYATNGTQSTQVKTNLSAAGITITNYNTYRVERTSAQVTFYVNGNQVAVHTSALPNFSGDSVFSAGVKNTSASIHGLRIKPNFRVRFKANDIT